MRIARYRDGEAARLGVVDGDAVRAAGGELFGALIPGERVGALADVTLLPPVAPSKIVAVGLNYADHVAESGPALDLPKEPVIFMKPPSSLLGHGGTILLPAGAEPVHYEAELAVVIGRRARHVRREDAYDYVLGLTCGNDVSARNYQQQDGQWVRAKGFDTFTPLGPWIATDLRADALAIQSRLNGGVEQSSNTRHLLFDVPFLIAFISGVMTLLPGDVIMTGTPAGVGPMHPGDRIEVEVEGIGTLANGVAAESA
ncbi:MAG TPA: fumarylacetoacetate hydrolase family protein [Thermomicrobiales bacterium]|nr:fumarylacetoacetate hydrolase family protein [Thermomicrobiales bacterium]